MPHRSVCPGCKGHFEHKNPSQKWCSIYCREQNKRHVRPVEYAPPMTEAVLRFRANMRRLAPKSAQGYRLFSHLLNIWFPLPGRTLRFDGSFSSKTYFALDPVEPPRVPFEEQYQLGFVFAEEQFLYAGPPYTHVIVTFPQAMSHGRMLAPFLEQLDHAAGIHPRALPQPQPRRRPVEVRLLTDRPPPWMPPFVPSENPNPRTNEDDET